MLRCLLGTVGVSQVILQDWWRVSHGDILRKPKGVAMKVTFRVFRSEGFSDLQLESTATAAAEFASSVEASRLINISHVLDGHIHIVTVWFWDTAGSHQAPT